MKLILLFATCSYFASLTYAAGTANFIVNGENAKPNSAPYIVSLQVSNSKNDSKIFSQNICSGIILNQNWVRGSYNVWDTF